MENEIKKAIEGGYTKWSYIEDYLDDKPSLTPIKLVLLDPLFWQALGKQQGWRVCTCVGDIDGKCIYKTGEKWLQEWHNFTNHIAQGGNIDEFFNKLLTN